MMGLGVSANQLNYLTSTPSASHVFYAGGTNNNGVELLRINGNGSVTASGTICDTNGCIGVEGGGFPPINIKFTGMSQIEYDQYHGLGEVVYTNVDLKRYCGDGDGCEIDVFLRRVIRELPGDPNAGKVFLTKGHIFMGGGEKPWEDGVVYSTILHSNGGETSWKTGDRVDVLTLGGVLAKISTYEPDRTDCSNDEGIRTTTCRIVENPANENPYVFTFSASQAVDVEFVVHN
jgi:hypothetical protein